MHNIHLDQSGPQFNTWFKGWCHWATWTDTVSTLVFSRRSPIPVLSWLNPALLQWVSSQELQGDRLPAANSLDNICQKGWEKVEGSSRRTLNVHCLTSYKLYGFSACDIPQLNLCQSMSKLETPEVVKRNYQKHRKCMAAFLASSSKLFNCKHLFCNIRKMF